jgi:hypothetical protein
MEIREGERNFVEDAFQRNKKKDPVKTFFDFFSFSFEMLTESFYSRNKTGFRPVS